jgi:hypothetical protein
VALFASTVVTPEQQPQLDARRTARAAYDALEATGGEWAPPLAVRRAMAGWAFEQAAALTETATDVLDVRDEIADTVEPLGPAWGLEAEAPATLEAAFESAGDDDDLSDLEATAGATLDAAHELAATGRRVASDRGVLEAIGLIGRDVDAAFTRAVTAYEEGDAATAAERAATVDRMLDGAGPAGRTRLAIAAAVAVSTLVVVALLLATRRHRRRRHPPPSPANVG